MHFSAIWRPKFKKHHRDSELSNNQTVKKQNLWGKMTVDKSVCIKGCLGIKNYTCLIGGYFCQTNTLADTQMRSYMLPK